MNAAASMIGVPVGVGGPSWDSAWVLPLIAVGGLSLLVFFIVLMKYGLLYLQAALSGAPVAMLALVGMSLRKVSPVTIVEERPMRSG